MAWGLEARVPFLDKEFLKIALDIKPEQKVFSKGSLQEKDKDGRPVMEKYVLRKAFDVAPQGERVSLPPDCSLSSRSEMLTSSSVSYSPTSPTRSSGVKRNNSLMVSCSLRSKLVIPLSKLTFLVSAGQVSDTRGSMDLRITLPDQFRTSKCQRLLSDGLSTLLKRKRPTSFVNSSKVTSRVRLLPRLLFDGFPELYVFSLFSRILEVFIR
jgi:hypothetical protein